MRICRVENFVYHHNWWGEVGLGMVQDLVSQVRSPPISRILVACEGSPPLALGPPPPPQAVSFLCQAFRAPSLLFKDKINFKGPGGGGFRPHQDATAYATDKLAKGHITVRLAIDESTVRNGPLEVAPRHHRRGILPHRHGIIEAAVEERLSPWEQARRGRNQGEAAAREGLERGRCDGREGMTGHQGEVRGREGEEGRSAALAGAGVAGRRGALRLLPAAPLGHQHLGHVAPLRLPHVQPRLRGRPARGLLPQEARDVGGGPGGQDLDHRRLWWRGRDAALMSVFSVEMLVNLTVNML